MSKRIIYIGITGKARSGKDTLASHLHSTAKEYDYGYERISFAEPLYAIARIFGFDTISKTAKTDFHPVWNMTLRTFLQVVGTDLFRDCFDKDVWIKLAKMKIDSLIEAHTENVVVFAFPDLRFDNEAKLVRDLSGVVVKIERPESPLALSGTESQHQSESGVDPKLIDITFINKENNNGAMLEFAKKLINMERTDEDKQKAF